MGITLFFAVLVGSGLVSGFDPVEKVAGTVIYTNILYRHGERAILSPSKKDPWGAKKYWPMGYGQLTNEGIRHHYYLGKWLRKRYIHLIPQGRYNHSVIRVQSSDVDRCLMSAEANLDGMFPPVDNEFWDPNVTWIPIPVHTRPVANDAILEEDAPCKKYSLLLKQFLKTTEYKTLNKKYKSLYKYINKYYGKAVTNPIDVSEMYSNFLIEEMFNYTLPTWTKKIYPNKLIEPAGISFKFNTWTTPLKRLKAGPLLKQLVTNMEKKVNGTLNPPRNISVYSFHDTNIGNLLNTLGMFNNISPPFAAVVLIELRKTSDDHVVTVQYKNSTNAFAEPILLTPPNCTTACPLTKFREIYSEFIPENWSAECKDVSEGDESDESDYEDSQEETDEFV